MAEEEPSIFFIGDVALDDYFSADRWPGIADKDYVRQEQSHVGGMIANAASVYASLGGRPQFISLLNRSSLSERLCHALNANGVQTEHMLHDPDMPDSRNLIFLVGGEHVVLTIDIGRAPMHLAPAAMEALSTPGYLYTTLNRAKRLRFAGEGGPPLLAKLRGSGRKFLLDLDVEGFAPEDVAFLQGADVLIMNRIGFGNAFGEPRLDDINAWMRAHSVRTLIRTLAEDGAEAYDGTSVTRVAGYRVPVVDVTGAGDTFGGALLFALSRGRTLHSALELAVAAASRAVTVLGPQGGMAPIAEIEAFRDTYAAGDRVRIAQLEDRP